MIFTPIIYIINYLVDLLFLPIQAISIGIDFVSGISILNSFFSVVYYLLPIGNILPLIFIVIAITIFKIVISLIKTIWELLPVV